MQVALVLFRFKIDIGISQSINAYCVGQQHCNKHASPIIIIICALVHTSTTKETVGGYGICCVRSPQFIISEQGIDS